MGMGSDASPLIFSVLRTARKFGVKCGFRPDVILFFKVDGSSDRNTTPGVVVTPDLGGNSSNLGRLSVWLDETAANKNEYVKMGSDDDNGIVINDEGFHLTESVFGAGDIVVFMLFRSSARDLTIDLSATTTTPETSSRDKSEDGNLFKINTNVSAKYHESGAMIEYYDI